MSTTKNDGANEATPVKAIPIYSDPCHLPCPDLPYHSLTKEDKERGLELMKKVKADFEVMRKTSETERGKRKRLWLEKLKEKSLRLPNRASF